VPRIKEHRRWLDKAGIAYTDSAGQRVDLHALRHTFGTMLGKAGVPMRSAMELMRHTDPKLTMRTYSHLRVIDVAGAVEKLPAFALPAGQQTAAATGTHGVGRTESATSQSADKGDVRRTSADVERRGCSENHSI